MERSYAIQMVTKSDRFEYRAYTTALEVTGDDLRDYAIEQLFVALAIDPEVTEQDAEYIVTLLFDGATHLFLNHRQYIVYINQPASQYVVVPDDADAKVVTGSGLPTVTGLVQL